MKEIKTYLAALRAHFRPDQPLPEALLRTIVLERVADIVAELARPRKGR